MKLFLIFVLAATERVVAAAGTKPPSTKGKGRRSRSPANSGSRSAGAGSRERKPNNPKAKAKRSSRSSSRGASVASSRSSSSGVHIEEEVASLEKTFREIAKEMVLATTQGRGPAKDRRTVLVVFSDGSSDSEQDSSDGSSGGSSDRSRDRRQDRTGAVASYAVYAQSYEIKRQRVPDDDDYETDGFLNDSGYVLDLKNTECGGRPCKFVVSLATSKAVNDEALSGRFVTAESQKEKIHSLAELLTRTETALVGSFGFDNENDKVANTLAAQYALAKRFRKEFFEKKRRWLHDELFNDGLHKGQKMFGQAVRGFDKELLQRAGVSLTTVFDEETKEHVASVPQNDFVSIRNFFLQPIPEPNVGRRSGSFRRTRSMSRESVSSSAPETQSDQGTASTLVPAVFRRREEGSSLELSSIAELRGLARAITVFAGRRTMSMSFDHVVFACDNKLALEEIRFGWSRRGSSRSAFAVPHTLVQDAVAQLGVSPAQEHGDAFYRFAWQPAGHMLSEGLTTRLSEGDLFFSSAQRFADAGARLFRKAVENPKRALAVPARHHDKSRVVGEFRKKFLSPTSHGLQTGIVAGLAFFKRSRDQQAQGTNLFTLELGVDPSFPPERNDQEFCGHGVPGSRVALGTLRSVEDSFCPSCPEAPASPVTISHRAGPGYDGRLSTILSDVGGGSGSVSAPANRSDDPDVANLSDVNQGHQRGHPIISIVPLAFVSQSGTRPGGAPCATGSLPRPRLGPVPENVQTWPQHQVVGHTPQPPPPPPQSLPACGNSPAQASSGAMSVVHPFPVVAPQVLVPYQRFGPVGDGIGASSTSRQSIRLRDGSMYNGFLKDGKTRHGWGRWTSADEQREYEGEWSDGSRHGYGVYRDTDGSTYNGQWKNHKRHGRGTLTLASGRVEYDGSWQNNKPHGQGVHAYSDGRKYDGHWCLGQRDGKGTLTFPNGRVEYNGGWLKDKYHGQGAWVGGSTYDVRRVGRRTTNEDGSTYDGQFVFGKRHGKGVLVSPDGVRYEGEFEGNEKHGQGVETLPDGSKYEGGFWNGRRFGKGKETRPDGSCHYSG
ncbi:unnamed protein product [Amoebophrya sp. A120]|nr:unnamed protein product [Amoebophrya sp. A120]|eukprot:GSA120T00025029001.1